MSDNGRLVAFGTNSSNLVAGIPASTKGQSYVRDMVTATTSLISFNAQGTAAANNDSNAIALSRDGSTAFLTSFATDIFLGDRNDRQSRDGPNKAESSSPAQEPSQSSRRGQQRRHAKRTL